MAETLRQAIQQIKERADLVEIVSRYRPLKRAGNSFKAPCPFHQEKTPSFHVVPAKGIFHCFGCGAGGSVIDFVMKIERMEMIEAVKKLANDLGIQLPESRPENRARAEAEQRAAQSIAQANSEAVAWFRGNLMEGANPLASAYLPERGLTEDLSDMFQLGASLDAWEGLKRHLLGLGFSEDLLVEADLLVRNENGRTYDRFRNRLMFPIFDQNGKPVGFGARQLVEDKKSGKYINTSETPLYKKGNLLYGLNLAQKSVEKAGYSIICEGYMDVIMCHAYGHTQAVAPLGTGLTAQQARLLKRYAPRAHFLFDGDEAGQRSMMSRGVSLLEAGIDVRVVSLPGEHDPDSFLRERGGDALHEYINDAIEFFDFATNYASRGVDLKRISGQSELAERLLPVLAALKNDVMRESAIQRLLLRLGGLPDRAILGMLEKYQRQKREESSVLVPAEPGEREAPSANVVPVAARYDGLDLHLLRMMLESPDALDELRARLRPEWLFDSQLRGWIEFLLMNEGMVGTLINQAEADGEPPGPKEALAAALAIEAPERACTREAAVELLRRVQERHQQVLCHDLMNMLRDGNLGKEDARRLLVALQHEHAERMEVAGQFLRGRDSKARRTRR